MALLPAVCPSSLFTESLVYLLSTSLLLHLKRYIFAVPEGAVQRVLSYWFQVLWNALSEGFAARSKKLSMPWFFVAWVCVQKDYRCVPIHLRHSQLEWMEDEDVGSCILSLLLPYYLFDLARVSQSFEANDHQPSAAFLRLQAVQQLEAVIHVPTEIVHSALRLQQTSNYLVWYKTWKLLKWNNISFHSEIY